MTKDNKIKNEKSGFTLVELLVAAFVILLVSAGAVMTILKSLELSEMAKNMNIAVMASKSRLEHIKNTPFAQIKPSFNGAIFLASGVNGRGISYVDDSNPDLLEVKVAFCWRQKNALVVGEDRDLDGVLDAGEDQNGNGEIDSIVSFTTNIYDE